MNPFLLSISEEKLKKKENMLMDLLKSCELCGHKCNTNRFKEKGICDSDNLMKVSSVFPHFGEESPLVGTGGSGTIFLSNCTCECVYCQNWKISQRGDGKKTTPEEVSDSMLNLQQMGCHNINLVTPTHYIPQLVKSLRIAKNKGLRIPVVYNTGGYDNPEIIKLLGGLIDIYMPDIKYGSNDSALKYSKVSNYWDTVRESVREMHNQVGDLIINENRIAERGLLIRHLLLPENISQSEKVLKFISDEISEDSYVNIMTQYRPCYRAGKYKELSRRITEKEYREAIERALDFGLYRGFKEI